MKTLCLALIILLSPLSGFSQKAAVRTPVTGMGRFKINKTTTAVIKELERELGFSTRKTNSSSRLEEARDSAVIFEVLPNSSDVLEMPVYYSYCPQSRVFMLPFYKFDELTVRGIYLFFQNDVLVEIRAEPSFALNDAFTEKYGPPKLSKVVSPFNCTHIDNGNTKTLSTSVVSKKWGAGSVVAEDYVELNYDVTCSPVINSYFRVSNPLKREQLTKCSLATEKVLNAKTRGAKISSGL